MDLLEQAKQHYTEVQVKKLQRALKYAREAHREQVRKSGEPYIMHPCSVALILMDLRMDVDTLCAALLHDVVEDTLATVEDIREEFGDSIALMVDGVTKLKKLGMLSSAERQAESLRKMILAMAKDIRVVLIKLADRLHNMRTLEYMDPAKQQRIAQETLEIYASLAHRLGIYSMKEELEELSLRYLHPQEYWEIRHKVSVEQDRRRAFMDRTMELIQRRLAEEGIRCTVAGRTKGIYSIYKKMRDQQRAFEQVYDVIALRVIVDTEPECYSVLGIIHSMYRPLPGRIKDYINLPTANNYRSLHTTCLGSSGQPFEVQIRTQEMHQAAEYGIAAHWKYKEGNFKQSEMDSKLEWLRKLLEWQSEVRDAQEFVESLKIDLYAEDVFVLTPKSKIITLTKGCTPLDFAYAIHSEVGDHCVGVKVNGKLMPFTYKLKNGDVVEVQTSKASAGPSRDWLDIVRSPNAKNRIRQWFKREYRDDNIVKGKDMLELAARRQGLDLPKLLRNEWLEPMYKKYALNGLDDMYAAIGYGALSTSHVLGRLVEEHKKAAKLDAPVVVTELSKTKEPRHAEHRPAHSKAGVRVKGEADMLVRFAKCCNPVPGDPIVGYITRGRGVSVHVRGCSNFQRLEDAEQRSIGVEWDTDERTSYTAEIQVIAHNRDGLIIQTSQILAQLQLNILSINAKVTKNHMTITNFTLEISDTQQLDAVLKRVQMMPGIVSVFRAHA